MQVAFYGVMRSAGTSANMAAVAAGFTYYFQIPVMIGQPLAVSDKEIIMAGQTVLADQAVGKEEAVLLTDCSPSTCPEESGMKQMEACDLLVLNLSLPCKNLEEIYIRHSLVRKNVMFLIGKYYQDKSQELTDLARQFRLPSRRISAIPYHPAFEAAYEKQEVSVYIRSLAEGRKTFGDLQFETQLKQTLHTVMTYGKRKGELYYG